MSRINRLPVRLERGRNSIASLFFALAVATASAPLCAQGLTVWVDPFGSDTSGNGSSANPYATISKGIVDVMATGGNGTVMLLPGFHDETEYPISIPAASNLTIRSSTPRAAFIAPPPITLTGPPPSTLITDAFRIDTGTNVNFRDLVFQGGATSIKVALGAGTSSLVEVTGCVFNLSGSNIRGATEGWMQLIVANNRFGSVAGIDLDADAGGSIQLLGLGDVFTSDIGIDFKTTDAGTIVGIVGRPTFDSCARYGVRTNAAVPGSINMTLENGAFFHCGHGVSGAGGAAILDVLPNTSWVVTDTAFWDGKNDRDMPSYSAANYAVNGCLVQQTTPAISGVGNLSGDPLWVNAADGDFHVLPSSPLIDVAVGAGYVDADGDPAFASGIPFGGAADIGVDNFYTRHIHLSPELALVSVNPPPATVAFTVVGPASATHPLTAMVLFDVQPAAPNWGPGNFQLPTWVYPNLFFLPTGPTEVSPGAGFAQMTTSVPFFGLGTPVDVNFQALFVAPSGATALSFNVCKIEMR